MVDSNGQKKGMEERRKFELVRYLRYFAILAGGFWAATLLFMLFWWLGHGQPNYPIREGYHIPYVSDVAAFTAKPVFIAGTTISAVFFIATIISLHYVRYDRRFHGLEEAKEARYGKVWYRSRVASVFSIISVLASGISLVLLSIFDTYRHENMHGILLFVLVFSTVFGVGCANVVYHEQIKEGADDRLLRRSCLAGNCVIFIEACLGVPFVILKAQAIDRPAVILEWIMGLLFSLYLWSLVGILGPVRLTEMAAGESSPLLTTPSH